MMVDLLSKNLDKEVFEAKNGMEVKADKIYICPPNKNILFHQNYLVLQEPDSGLYGPKPSVDILFESLAYEKREKAIGIILSGTGSDGARGVRAIKAEGGFTLAQDPATAKYDGMPNAAIHTESIDIIIKPESMGMELLEISTYPEKVLSSVIKDEFSDLYHNILSKLQAHKGVDFNVYKPSTIQRRIERRMVTRKITNLAHYYEYLQNNSEEIDALFNDILIGVTSFFRDKEAFDALEDTLRKYLSENENDNKNIRIWAPACSTGEEAYSLAMLLSKILDDKLNHYKIQIFATDIDERSLSFSRKGLYPESALIDMDREFREKYFQIKNEHYEVIKPIREMIIFSKHNIIKDPAFLRLDLLVCRNLLIYFSQDLQKKLFPEFHYALKDNGLLFLGKSESVGYFQSHFKTIEKKWKLYQAAYLGRKEPPKMNSFTLAEHKFTPNSKNLVQGKKSDIHEKMLEYINHAIIPKCLIINDNMDIVYVKGQNPYLVRPDGEQTSNIFRNVLATLNIELRAVIHNCVKEQQVSKSRFQKVLLVDEVIRYVRITVSPLESNNAFLYFICFQEEDNEQFKAYELTTGSDENEHTKELEFELTRTKEYLQTVVEELETSNEEMQSLNEELQSSNEELQSSNEELETTNEELQSTNEELQTAYTELRSMYDEKEESTKEIFEVQEELKKSNKRLEVALNSSKLGISEYHIPIEKDDYWSEMWADILGYKHGGLPFDKTNMFIWIDERIHPDDIDKIKSLRDKYIHGEIKEYKLKIRMKHRDGNWIWLKVYIRPSEVDFDGRVIKTISTIQDFTDEEEKAQTLETITTKLQNSQRLVSLGTWEWNILDGTLWWSDEVYDIFKIKKEKFDLTYENFLKLLNAQDRKNIEIAVKEALKGKPYEIKHQVLHSNSDSIIVKETGIVIFEKNEPVRMLGAIQDVSTETHLINELIEYKENLQIATNASNIGLWEMTALDGKVSWDKRSYEIFGISEGTEVSYDVWNKLLHPEDARRVKDAIQHSLEKHKLYNILFKIVRKDGTTRYIQASGNPIYEYGVLKKFVGVNLDLTDYMEGIYPHQN